MNTPSFQEDHVSQVPALQLLQNLGYTYLRPQEVFLERKGKLGNVLLENILAAQLRRLNRIKYRGNDLPFSDANIEAAIAAGELRADVEPSAMAFRLNALGMAANWQRQLLGDPSGIEHLRSGWREELDRQTALAD